MIQPLHQPCSHYNRMHAAPKQPKNLFTVTLLGNLQSTVYNNIPLFQGLRLMKERKRVAWILLLLAVLFAMCWMPYNIMQLLLDVNLVNAKDLSMVLPYALFMGKIQIYIKIVQTLL